MLVLFSTLEDDTMAMPHNAKERGHYNYGWFEKKYKTKEELDEANKRNMRNAYEKHKLKRIYGSWVRQIGELGCSIDLYEQFWAIQGGGCALCRMKTKRKLAVDHCHKFNRVRGLLCSTCNTGLHMIEKNPEVINRIGDYLCLGTG